MGRKEELEVVIRSVEEAQENAETLRDSLQDALDGWSGTNFENTEQYQQYENAVSELDDACSELQAVADRLEEVLE